MTPNIAPGVHVKEVEQGAKPIAGVSTSTAGFLGPTERGPTEPRLVTSFADYRRLYGGYLDDSYLAPAVEGFFTNGGSRAFVGRVTRASNPAEYSLLAGSGGGTPDSEAEKLWPAEQIVDFGPGTSSTTTQLSLSNLGVAGEDSAIEITSGDLSVSDTNVWGAALGTSSPLTISAGDSASIDVTFQGSPEAVTGTLTIAHDGSNSPVEVTLRGGESLIDVEAIGPGEWGSHIAVFVDDATMYAPGKNQLFKVTLRYWADDEDLKIAKRYHGNTDNDAVPEPDVEEEYDDLSPEPSASNFYESVVNPASNLVDLHRKGPGRPANTAANAPNWLSYTPAPGKPAEINSALYKGDATLPPNERTGFAGFETIDGISIICVPDEHRHGVTTALYEHCVGMQDRFGILQAPRSTGNPSDVSPSVNSDYTAYYYPWVNVISSETGNEIQVPPGGHVAGIYARSDGEHGVHKAPANEVVRGAQSLQFDLNDADQAGLNARGVNCIRSFRGRGIRVWGARTTSPDPAWKYLNVRRLFLYLRESIEEGTQWVVFEPNDSDLWARVEQTIRDFLTGVWEDGALMGTTPEEAFYVKCDRTTMTQNDIDNGRLVCEIGVAPVKPAEFVIFEISQWTGSSEG
jgi:phage tail sheath protein FI